MIPEHYLEKVYAGLLGLNIGIRLGAPVEPPAWTFERIEKIYGEISGYIKPYKNFAADDDMNGPYYFLRALDDDAHDRDITADDVGRAWLNYAREGVGMFWWGGEGVSTEHTAFLNLKKGMSAPLSGSIEANGQIMAEQIGGQIFIDTWGLVLPGDYFRAADFGGRAASVSHDGNGVYGARFMTACISKAFVAKSVEEIIEAGLETIPASCTYAQVVRAVVDFHKQNPDDFRKCMTYLIENWGYDKYLGVCHIIPNAGVCILSLLYGGGDLSRTVEIATMCGWDTDCNAGNVGTIAGVFQGLSGVEDKYRSPINDSVVLSGISGYLNILDLPTYAKEVAMHGYRLAGKICPSSIDMSDKRGEIHFDFELEGSTHNFRLSNPNKFTVKNLEGYSQNGSRTLEVMFDRLTEGDSGCVFYKPFYRRHDFNDERYKPTFAPTVYSGQRVEMGLYLDQWDGPVIDVKSYVRKTHSQEIVVIDSHDLNNNAHQKIAFDIPCLDGDLADEVGLIISSDAERSNRALGRLMIDTFDVTGNAHYSVDFAKQSEEFLSITPFAMNGGQWELSEAALLSENTEETVALTGNYYGRNMRVRSEVKPEQGKSHLVGLRAQGIQRGYFAGLSQEGEAAIYLYDFGLKKLDAKAFEWHCGKTYAVEVKAEGSKIDLIIDGALIVSAEDETFDYGMAGFGNFELGRRVYKSFEVDVFE